MIKIQFIILLCVFIGYGYAYDQTNTTDDHAQIGERKEASIVVSRSHSSDESEIGMKSEREIENDDENDEDHGEDEENDEDNGNDDGNEDEHGNINGNGNNRKKNKRWPGATIPYQIDDSYCEL